MNMEGRKKQRLFCLLANLYLVSFSYLAAAGGRNQRHTKHDKNIFKMKYLVNYTKAIISSNHQILW